MDTHANDEQHMIAPTTNPTPEHRIPFEFTGNANEFFSIWIINVLLTILTLGIYSPWAKVRTLQYFYGNIQLDGASFRYLASPLQILKGRAIALVFFAAYYFSGLISPLATGIMIGVIALLIPAMVVMSMSFQLRNTAYRNIKFNFQKNFKRAYTIFAYPLLLTILYFLFVAYFQDSFLPTAAAAENETETPSPSIFSPFFLFVILPLLPIVCLFPLWQYMIIKFKSSHACFGQADFSFNGTLGDLYSIYIKAFLVVSVFGLLAMFAFNGLLGFILTLPLYLWLLSYIQTKKTNFIFGNLNIAEHRVQSDLKVGAMLYLYVTNTLAIAISLGLLMPWAKIRTARYRAQMTSIIITGDLDNFFGVQPEGQSAFGEEMGEVFDMGLGV
ncbi:MAG: DUF898 domain-containing protein [Gammaproteobacteria bacterium]|nr:DUF898 domain-containing protein [Gammaproteobacteria bacterium]MCF6258946.1 DUF898 domain-containing protein [Gammaproteobacteria bacterium]